MNGLVAQSGPVIPDFGEASDCVQQNRLFCPDWVRDNWGDVLQPALEDVDLVLVEPQAVQPLLVVEVQVADVLAGGGGRGGGGGGAHEGSLFGR